MACGVGCVGGNDNPADDVRPQALSVLGHSAWAKIAGVSETPPKLDNRL